MVVWGRIENDGTRHIIARATVALPSHHHAAYAEAFGCRTALEWVADRGGYDHAVCVAGGNLAVLRYCAHVGRMRRPTLQALLERPLGDVFARKWSAEWSAIRRRFNQEADRLATAGVQLSARLAESGSFDIVVRWT